MTKARAMHRRQPTFAEVYETLPVDRFGKRPRMERADFPNDAALDAYDLAVEELARARRAGAAVVDIKPLQMRVTEARQQVFATCLTFFVRALPGRRYRELVAEHPPQEEDHQAARSGGGPGARAEFHAESFAPVLVRESCVHPQFTKTDVEEIWASWSEPEKAHLFQQALRVNITRRVIVPGARQPIREVADAARP